MGKIVHDSESTCQGRQAMGPVSSGVTPMEVWIHLMLPVRVGLYFTVEQALDEKQNEKRAAH